MSGRRVVGVAALLTVITFICGGAALWALAARLPAAPALPATAEDSAATASGMLAGRIVVVGEDGNIWTMEPDGTAQTPLTDDASTEQQYRYPTWSPDGETLAFVEVDMAEGADGGALVLRPLQGQAQRVPLTEPPFYLFWSPTGDAIAFLSASGRAMALRLLEIADSVREPVILSEGAPFYFSWHPDGERLLAHIGTDELSFLDRRGTREPLDVAAGRFQAPHWSADGARLAYVAEGGGQENILNVSDASGAGAQAIAREAGQFTLNWSPDSQRIAYSYSTERVGLPAFGPLWVRDLATGSAWELSKEPVVAFFWSPDGKQVAFLRPDFARPGERAPQAAPLRQEQRLWLRWHVWNGKRTYPLTRFSPSESFLLDYLRYFDQYAQSVALWSPDSRALLFAGQTSAGREGIWVLPVAEGSQAYRIARGGLAAWSPR